MLRFSAHFSQFPIFAWAGLALLLGSLSAHAQAPTITALSPVRNQRQAPTNSPVAVTFSQPMQNTAATQQAVRVFSQQRGGLMFGSTRGTTTVSGNTVSFDPATDFKPGETVYVTTTTGATTTTGSALRRGQVHQFTATVSGPGRGTFVAPGTNAEPSVDDGPISVAMGDVDGDGDLDLLTSNLFPDNVSVRLNNGAGTFSGSQTVSVDAAPSSVVLGDVDGDGDLDLVTANFGSGTASVRLNDGTGFFSGTQNIPVGIQPGSVAAGDFDGDGDLDLVVANYNSPGSGSVSVLLNNGSGVFSITATVSVGDEPRKIVVGDVDGDGDLDFLTVNLATTAHSVSVRLNDGGGTFSSAPDVPLGQVGAGPLSLAVADVDGDGDLDLLAGIYSGALNTVSVRLNDGAGTFSGTQEVGVGRGPLDLAMADVDSDGDLDLFSANKDVSTVSVRLNDGAGVFSGTQDIPVGTTPRSSTPRSVAMADVDGDGDLDLLAANKDDNTVSVRLNGGTGPIGTAPEAASAPFSLYPTLADAGTPLHITGAPAHQPLALLDATGRNVVIMQTDATGAATLPAAALRPGLYVVRAADGRTRRLVVE